MKWLAAVIASILLSIPGIAAAGRQEFYGDQLRMGNQTMWGNGIICSYVGQTFVLVDLYLMQDYDGNYINIDASFNIVMNSSGYNLTRVNIVFQENFPGEDWWSMSWDAINGTEWHSAAEVAWESVNTP